KVLLTCNSELVKILSSVMMSWLHLSSYYKVITVHDGYTVRSRTLYLYKDIEPTPSSVFCVPSSNPSVIEICWSPFDCANDIVLKKYNDTIRNNFFMTKLLPSAHRHIQI
ncbi:MAG: hypothetical protein IKJ49_06500, partial [Bacteroidaceae bacterium]|nr:hypothetical protein [Bacteroidaceae bacterium]